MIVNFFKIKKSKIFIKKDINMKKYFIYFIIFIAIRMILWNFFPTNLDPSYNPDNWEYNYIATTLQPCPKEITGYTINNWYERSPLYVTFLYIIKCNILFQILFCGLAGTLAFKLNKYLGIYYLLYPNYIFQSFNYSKEALLVSLTLIAFYFLKERKYYLLISIIIINLGFLGYSKSIIEFNLDHSFKFMQAVYEIWKPSPDINLLGAVGNVSSLILFVPFWLIVPFYFRLIKKMDISLIFAIGITLFYSFGWANPRYKDAILPFMIFYIIKEGYADTMLNKIKILKNYIRKHIK
jgi:hypothetical protein